MMNYHLLRGYSYLFRLNLFECTGAQVGTFFAAQGLMQRVTPSFSKRRHFRFWILDYGVFRIQLQESSGPAYFCCNPIQVGI